MRRILNNAISLIVVVIVLFLVIPLHPSVLDVLLILNISLSIMILMITMNISEPLEFSIFPSLLLITTLFRLGLNVSSTRLILKNGGNAGVVIKAFGDLITQGNIVIGILIFLIIVLVQFIVITKGAERVSEVAARFTLDAMPGKQMAIDADLSSGLINEKEARLRRQKIQREADFYGAMDGATKIVKGDAVCSLRQRCPACFPLRRCWIPRAGEHGRGSRGKAGTRPKSCARSRSCMRRSSRGSHPCGRRSSWSFPCIMRRS